MSIQFNYFASEADETVIRALMLDYLGALYVLPKRAEKVSMLPFEIDFPGDWRSCKLVNMAIVVPVEYFHLLEMEEVSNELFWVNYRAFPCLEYVSSRLSEGAILHSGRIAYFYAGEDPMKERVQRLIRSLRKRARKVPGKVVPWIFDDAATTARELVYPPNMIEPNPLFK